MPGRGLEPPQIALLVPKTNASTNFATRAGVILLQALPYRNGTGCRPVGWQPFRAAQRFFYKKLCLEGGQI